MAKLKNELLRTRPARPAQFSPEFGDLNDLRIVFGLKRSYAYARILAGDFKTINIRQPGKSRGKLLIDFNSVRKFLASKAAALEETVK